MREKYESLPLSTLKDLAKARGLKGISTMKKAELIERMLEEDEKEKQASPPTGFWRCFPTGTDLSEAPTICRGRTTCTSHPLRFASLT